MGVFDALVIEPVPGLEVAEIARPVGPIEAGALNPAWMPAAQPTRLENEGFGLDATGTPYFDTAGADAGEHAVMFIDAVNGLIWLEPA